MKTLYILIFTLISYLNLLSQDTLKTDIIQSDSCLIESYINNDCDKFNCPCIRPSWEMKMLQSRGYCFFYDFNKEEYENKNIGFIIESFSKKYKYLGEITFHGFEKHKPKDKFRRNTFYFYFKLNDSVFLSINGCINFKDEKIIKNDKKALQHILKQNRFIMNFIQINMVKYFNLINQDTIDDFERLNNIEWKLMKKHFNYLFPKKKGKSN